MNQMLLQVLDVLKTDENVSLKFQEYLFFKEFSRVLEQNNYFGIPGVFQTLEQNNYFGIPGVFWEFQEFSRNSRSFLGIPGVLIRSFFETHFKIKISDKFF